MPINNIRFNQDGSLFCVCHTDGYSIYNVDPFECIDRVRYDDGGLGNVEMLYQSNLLALVGGGSATSLPKFPVNKVILFDAKRNEQIGQVEVRLPVTGVRMDHNVLVISVSNRVYIYSIDLECPPTREAIKFLGAFDSLNRKQSSLAVEMSDKGVCTIAFPGKPVGTVEIVRLNTGDTGKQEISLGGIMTAHDSQIACLAVSKSGRHLATCSQKGTLIRVFDIQQDRGRRSMTHEFRRGLEHVEINSMTFSDDDEKLLVCDGPLKGTIHVFNLDTCLKKTVVQHPKQLKHVLPKYFTSTWSHAQIHLDPGDPFVARFCRVGKDNMSLNPAQVVLVIRQNGLMNKYLIDEERGGEAALMSTVSFDIE